MKNIRIKAYQRWCASLKNSASQEDKFEAMRILNNLRKLLGMTHDDIMKAR